MALQHRLGLLSGRRDRPTSGCCDRLRATGRSEYGLDRKQDKSVRRDLFRTKFIRDSREFRVPVFEQPTFPAS